jgi:hypothetical protein
VLAATPSAPNALFGLGRPVDLVMALPSSAIKLISNPSGPSSETVNDLQLLVASSYPD